MLKVVGIKHRDGQFEGNAYDNYYIYVIDDEKQEKTLGICPNSVKVKASIIHKLVAADQVDKLMNKNIEFLYDQYKNVCVVNLK